MITAILYTVGSALTVPGLVVLWFIKPSAACPDASQEEAWIYGLSAAFWVVVVGLWVLR